MNKHKKRNKLTVHLTFVAGFGSGHGSSWQCRLHVDSEGNELFANYTSVLFLCRAFLSGAFTTSDRKDRTCPSVCLQVSKSASTESRLSRTLSGDFTKDSTTSSVSSESQLSLSRDDIASSLERPYDAEGPEINEVRTALCAVHVVRRSFPVRMVRELSIWC